MRSNGLDALAVKPPNEAAPQVEQLARPPAEARSRFSEAVEEAPAVVERPAPIGLRHAFRLLVV